MMRTCLKGEDSSSSILLSKEFRSSPCLPQKNLEDASQSEYSLSSKGGDNRRNVYWKKKKARGCSITTPNEDFRKDTEAKRKLLDGNEVDGQDISKKCRWTTEADANQQDNQAEAGSQPRIQP
jgi:hypothetical protein